MRTSQAKSIALRILAACGLLAVAGAGAQPIFKCVNPEGEVAFQDSRCAPGQIEHAIEIAPAPPATPVPSPDRAGSSEARAARVPRMRRSPSAAVEMSYECRTASGALFYRHGGCPSVIGKESSKQNLHASRGERVQTRRIPRAEACRSLRSVGRRGREHDDTTSTYDKNLGRDPCRRY